MSSSTIDIFQEIQKPDATLESIETLLNEDPSLAGQRGTTGYFPIHVAIRVFGRKNGFLRLLKLLIRLIPHSVNIPTEDGDLPIHFATFYHSQREVVVYLLKEFPGGANRRNRADKLPIEHSYCNLYDAYYHDRDMLKLMVEANPEIFKNEDKNGKLLLHNALGFRNSSEIVPELVKRHPPMLYHKDKDGNLPIHCALGPKDSALDIIKLLVDAYEGCLAVQNKNNFAPLHAAIYANKSKETVEFLLTRYPEAASMKCNITSIKGCNEISIWELAMIGEDSKNRGEICQLITRLFPDTVQPSFKLLGHLLKAVPNMAWFRKEKLIKLVDALDTRSGELELKLQKTIEELQKMMADSENRGGPTEESQQTTLVDEIAVIRDMNSSLKKQLERTIKSEGKLELELQETKEELQKLKVDSENRGGPTEESQQRLVEEIAVIRDSNSSLKKQLERTIKSEGKLELELQETKEELQKLKADSENRGGPTEESQQRLVDEIAVIRDSNSSLKKQLERTIKSEGKLELKLQETKEELQKLKMDSENGGGPTEELSQQTMVDEIAVIRDINSSLKKQLERTIESEGKLLDWVLVGSQNDVSIPDLKDLARSLRDRITKLQETMTRSDAVSTSGQTIQLLIPYLLNDETVSKDKLLTAINTLRSELKSILDKVSLNNDTMNGVAAAAAQEGANLSTSTVAAAPKRSAPSSPRSSPRKSVRVSMSPS